MGERKVINKYLPPDFDPSLVPRSKKPKDGLVSVRMMLPFSIQCRNCSTFMYQGRKFNSKKENVQGPNGKYLGIQRFRFYIKCTSCAQPISFLTDPKNADYEMESGATRNYELSKDRKAAEESALQELEDGEKEDPLKGLENRVLASQREMEDMDNLEEIKALNLRHTKLLNSAASPFDAKTLLEARAKTKKQTQEHTMQDATENSQRDEEEMLVKAMQATKQRLAIDRLSEEDEERSEIKRIHQVMMFEKSQVDQTNAKTRKRRTPVVAVKKRRINSPPESKSFNIADDQGSAGLSSLLGGYGSDSDSSSAG